MTTFQVVAVRGPLDESVHHVSVAVADAEGRLVAQARTPELVTFWLDAGPTIDPNSVIIEMPTLEDFSVPAIPSQ